MLCNFFLYINNFQKYYSVSRYVISIIIVFAPTCCTIVLRFKLLSILLFGCCRIIWCFSGMLMKPKNSPVRCTILTLAAVTFKREQNKNNLREALVWGQPNTLRRLSQRSFYNSRVLERSQSRVPLCEEDVGAFIVVRHFLLSL